MAGRKKAKPAKAKAGRRREHGGLTVNPEIKLPRPPGGWVDEVRNHITGELFADFKAGITMEDGARRLRQEAKRQGVEPYLSRGPVLWAMHVLKLEAWYLEAMNDGAAWDNARRRPLELATPRRRKVKRPARTYTLDPRYGF